MRQGRRRCPAMPVLLARRKPNDIARVDFLDGAALTLDPAAAGSHYEGLAKGMRVPSRARAGFECDDCAPTARGTASRERRVDSHAAGKPVRWPPPGGL